MPSYKWISKPALRKSIDDLVDHRWHSELRCFMESIRSAKKAKQLEKAFITAYKQSDYRKMLALVGKRKHPFVSLLRLFIWRQESDCELQTHRCTCVEDHWHRD